MRGVPLIKFQILIFTFEDYLVNLSTEIRWILAQAPRFCTPFKYCSGSQQVATLELH